MTDDAITGLEGDLRTNGIDVASIDPGDPLAVRYTTSFPGDRIDHGEMGRLCNVLIDRAEAGEWEPVHVDVTVERFAGDVLGTWAVEPAWIEGLLSYRFSEEEFSERVLDSLSEAGEAGDAADGTGEESA